ncbi:hypothetical protein GWI33_002024 [Rhynchophorus ferrugineus]|uniref:Uncharacterized protein n=1 Tax=Rhynchophorus ferrugineus TaxID=354439 RepID=A0A834MKD5_RHYFE|nr:hypothetical protein GWI33_002024 [Rhynchophorus ferrugineus]
MVRVFYTVGFVLVISCVGVLGQDYEGNSVVSSRGLDAKDVLTSIATNLMSRGFTSTGNGSQVVSLNVTNLLILILLKALIFAAGSLGAGHFKGGYGRSLDGEEKLVTDEEILMYLTYLTGSAGDNGCLQTVACQQPHQAKKYVNAGDLLLKTAKVFSMDVDHNYEYVLREVDQAANVGMSGGSCRIFRCSSNT